MNLSELVDIGELRGLCESFTAITGAVTAVLDLEGNVLIATGWQDICTKFHRVNPQTCARCLESDTVLAGHLSQGNTYNVYRCKNGLVDVAVPITIGDEHVANFFTGQFFFEPPDQTFFMRQAQEFGFDETAYLGAMARAPVFSEKQVQLMMAFFTRLAKVMGEMGLAKLRLQQANTQLQQSFEIIQSSEDAIIGKTLDGTINSWNPGAEKIFGYTAREAIGSPMMMLIPADRLEEEADIISRVSRGETVSHLETLRRRKDGELINVSATISPILDGAGHVVGSSKIARDITERKRAEALVRELAYYDPLTKLANRILLKDRLTQSMLAGGRSGHYGALMFLDLDNFKPLNDLHGHEAGDHLLVEVARRLKSCVRQIDTVARFGGDEFVVLLHELTMDKVQAHLQADLVAGKIRNLLGSPYLLQTGEHRCTASIGVALFRGQENSMDEVLRWADLAMYNAKETGRNRVCFCDAQMWTENRMRLMLEHGLAPLATTLAPGMVR